MALTDKYPVGSETALVGAFIAAHCRCCSIWEKSQFANFCSFVIFFAFFGLFPFANRSFLVILFSISNISKFLMNSLYSFVINQWSQCVCKGNSWRRPRVIADKNNYYDLKIKIWPRNLIFGIFRLIFAILLKIFDSVFCLKRIFSSISFHPFISRRGWQPFWYMSDPSYVGRPGRLS